jgi:uncharacterized protein (DUF2252 family)
MPARADGSVEDRARLGRDARRKVPRSCHRAWAPAADRADPISLLEEQNAARVPWLVPIRHLRMRASPFTFYRGTAVVMAADLATTPTSGLSVQLGGDAHLSNFGFYASPERHLVFDANDFDETLRGPWEWDLKRLATSFLIAGAHLGFPDRVSRAVTANCVRAYRAAMAQLAGRGFVDVWYEHVRIEDLGTPTAIEPEAFDRRRLDRFARRARRRTSQEALHKFAVPVGGCHQIRSAPPALFPLRDLPEEYDAPALEAAALRVLESYKDSLNDDRRWLLDRYTPIDVGVKVVGVGSVGTRCLIILLTGRDGDDPLFLQVKEAVPSVLEPHLDPSPYANEGRRVVEGQRLVQARSDLFLGWAASDEGRHFYLRQLRDWKGTVEIEGATPDELRFYAGLCGRTLARGHARSGDPVAIAAYAGGGDPLDRAVCDFAEAYAAQNQVDYERFLGAVEGGRLPVAASA